MTGKPVVPRTAAISDVDEIIGYYLETSPDAITVGFVDVLESAYAQIGLNPAIGSPRYAYEVELPGLRSWLLNGYPNLIFYLECGHHIDVWSILHVSRDISRWMQEPDGSE